MREGNEGLSGFDEAEALLSVEFPLNRVSIAAFDGSIRPGGGAGGECLPRT